VVEALPKAAYVSAMRKATDPEGEGKHDPEKIVARAKKAHGEKFAKDLDSGADKMHFGRTKTYGYDKLASRTSPRVTQAGKANKQDISSLKNKIKSGY
jgi:anaerobic selenocysteine-containing dehydrogenase